MSFTLNQVLDSQKQFYESLLEGKSSSSTTKYASFNDVRAIVHAVADNFFSNDFVAFLGGLDVKSQKELVDFTPLEGHLSSKDSLNDAIRKVACTCHEKNAVALDEKRTLTKSERVEIKKAFADLVETFSKSDETVLLKGRDIKLLCEDEVSEVVIKCSEAFVNSVNTFTLLPLRKFLESNKVNDKNLKQAFFSTSKKLFADELCTKVKLDELKKEMERPNLQNLSVEESYRKTTEYLIHLVLTDSLEKNSETALNALSLKLAQCSDAITSENKRVADSKRLVLNKEKLAKLNKELYNKKVELQGYIKNTAYVQHYKDLSKPVKDGQDVRTSEIKKLETQIKDLEETIKGLEKSIKESAPLAKDLVNLTTKHVNRQKKHFDTFVQNDTNLEIFQRVLVAFVDFAQKRAETRYEFKGWFGSWF